MSKELEKYLNSAQKANDVYDKNVWQQTIRNIEELDKEFIHIISETKSLHKEASSNVLKIDKNKTK